MGWCGTLLGGLGCWVDYPVSWARGPPLYVLVLVVFSFCAACRSALGAAFPLLLSPCRAPLFLFCLACSPVPLLVVVQGVMDTRGGAAADVTDIHPPRIYHRRRRRRVALGRTPPPSPPPLAPGTSSWWCTSRTRHQSARLMLASRGARLDGGSGRRPRGWDSPCVSPRAAVLSRRLRLSARGVAGADDAATGVGASHEGRHQPPMGRDGRHGCKACAYVTPVVRRQEWRGGTLVACREVRKQSVPMRRKVAGGPSVGDHA